MKHGSGIKMRINEVYDIPYIIIIYNIIMSRTTVSIRVNICPIFEL